MDRRAALALIPRLHGGRFFRESHASWVTLRVVPTLLATLALWGGSTFAASASPGPSDAPDPGYERPRAMAAPASYAVALATWRTAESVNDWIAARFEYDSERAFAMSESARAAGGRTVVYEPEAFFAQPRGVCVDLARFAVVTLGRVEPQLQPAYVMIEFEPLVKDGQVLRRHWLASFRRDGAWYFFADSKRPGHIAGPYAGVEPFVAEYAVYRGRPVVSYRITDTYERRLRTPHGARGDVVHGERSGT